MVCQDYEELLGAYALGALDDEERRDLEVHLAGCSRCLLALQEYQSVVNLLPLAVPEIAPPANLKSKIMAQITTGPLASTPAPITPIPIQQQTKPRRNWRSSLALVAVVVLCFLLGGMGAWNFTLQQQLPVVYAMQGTGDAAGATGEVRYYPQQHVVMVVMQNLPALKDNQVYQGWFMQGQQPKSLGLFNVQNNTATLTYQGDIQGIDMAAISREQGPQASKDAPKGPVIASGALR
jgi:anti-sigma-K factor RskA